MASISSRALTRVSSQRVITRRVTRALSSQLPAPVDDEFKHPQEFVKMQFEPGDWDPNRTDPLFRPPFKARAKIMSAEDFAERPRVGFEEEFDSLKDGMVTFSWLDSSDTDKVYAAYLEIMSKSAGKVTSHEYVMRVLAQRFNMTSFRAAAIVQLAHNEEQIRKSGGKIWTEAQDYVDQKVKEHIAQAYSEYGEIDPQEFVEDPPGIHGTGTPEMRTATHVQVDEMLDVDKLLEDAQVREQNDARVIIDGHIYIEDHDEDQRNVKISKEAKKLIERKMSYQRTDESVRRMDLKPMPAGDAPRRTRWKYAAHLINTRDPKKKLYAKDRKKGVLTENIIIEQDGELRPATVAEVKSTCWKPIRNTKEFALKGVKDAWLERTLRGETGGWGRQQAPPELAKAIEASEVLEEDAKDADENEEESKTAAETKTGDEESTEDTAVAEDSPEAASDESQQEPAAAADEVPSDKVVGTEDSGDDKKE